MVIFHHLRLSDALKAAEQSSLTTHPGALATEAARYLAFLLFQAIHRTEETTARDFLIRSSLKYAEGLEASTEPEIFKAQEEVKALATSTKERMGEVNLWGPDDLNSAPKVQLLNYTQM